MEQFRKKYPKHPLSTGKKGNKFGAVKTEIDGIVFDSRKESLRYEVLSKMQKHGEIADLLLQQKFSLTVNENHICYYVADFQYKWYNGIFWENIVEDVKSEITRELPVYRIKKKLMFAIYGITIKEV